MINDGLGHLAGDEFLIAVAQQLHRCLRSGDTVGPNRPRGDHRPGGGAMSSSCCWTTCGHPADAARVAERIQKQLAAPFTVNGQEIATSVSIGIALNQPDTRRPEELLRDADTALYRAKALGRSRYEVFDQAMHEQAMARLQLETDFRKAIEQQQLLVHYQPIMDLREDAIQGF